MQSEVISRRQSVNDATTLINRKLTLELSGKPQRPSASEGREDLSARANCSASSYSSFQYYPAFYFLLSLAQFLGVRHVTLLSDRECVLPWSARSYGYIKSAGAICYTGPCCGRLKCDLSTLNWRSGFIGDSASGDSKIIASKKRKNY